MKKQKVKEEVRKIFNRLLAAVKLDLLHKSKIVEGFLGETKPATFAYTARK
ncbi:hypothetical protein [Candidatus Tisiphia endosymbiont of Ptychoptera albimana]|uniref:hypothetical protein n=1 Tax=Candidatus Tisiphia endosymbiont of Ptychoptera albimana TaxID=3066260 RepID=UPI00312CB6C0